MVAKEQRRVLKLLPVEKAADAKKQPYSCVVEIWQREEKKGKRDKQEWKLIEMYVENEDKDGVRRGRSATRREGREGLAKALEMAKLHLVDVVVVTKLDRIARNVKDYIDISANFSENGGMHRKEQKSGSIELAG